jgi:hypothetical protein
MHKQANPNISQEELDFLLEEDDKKHREEDMLYEEFVREKIEEDLRRLQEIERERKS